jgi:3-oxoacyl-[acyl-carrier protein] reductase
MSNNALLRGKIILVTGSGRGIGLAIVRAALQHGAQVILNARKPGSLDSLCANLNSETTTQACPLYFDVSDPIAVKVAFVDLQKRWGRLDVLVNNAGILRDSLIEMSAPTVMREVFDTNCFGALYCIQYAVRLMKRNKSGSIINISSIIGARGNSGQAIYGASKAALLGATLSLAKELAPAGIRVNAITPGFIDTDMIKGVPETKAREIIAGIKMGRIGRAEEVAGACIFLASELSSYVTGQVIGVDGGMLV